MKIFLSISNYPDPDGEAVEIVTHQAIEHMLAKGHHVIIQPLIRSEPNARDSSKKEKARRLLSDIPRVELLDTLYLPELRPTPGPIGRKVLAAWNYLNCLPVLRNRVNRYLFIGSAAQEMVSTRVKNQKADIIFSIWSWESLAAAYCVKGVPKYIYYGNPDHKPREMQLAFPELFSLPQRGLVAKAKLFLQRLTNEAVRIQHTKMMKACEMTSNNSLVDANFYRDEGHPRSVYLQNMWNEAKLPPKFGGSGPPQIRETRIIASVGNQGATGNTLGLYCLGHEIAPALEKRVDAKLFSLDILGQGKPSAPVAQGLRHPLIRHIGWVENIEQEILDSTAFLVLTNTKGFVVGNTRILLAWSLGACVIAFYDSALSMPELAHGENVLLARTPEEIVGLIIQASNDSDLREKIGKGGYETFLQYYKANDVMTKMLAQMETCVKEFAI